MNIVDLVLAGIAGAALMAIVGYTVMITEMNKWRALVRRSIKAAEHSIQYAEDWQHSSSIWKRLYREGKTKNALLRNDVQVLQKELKRAKTFRSLLAHLR